MKRINLLFLFFILAGCDGNPFVGNAFSSLDEFTMDLGSSSTSELIELAFLEGENFYSAINSEEEYTLIVDSLTSTINNPTSTPAQVQQAAYVLAQVDLTISGASDSLNNATAHATELTSMNGNDPAEMGEFLFGADATSDEIVAQITGLLDSVDALAAYGATLDSTSPDSHIDPNLMGMQALSAGIISYMVTDMVVNGGHTQDEAITALANFYAEPDGQTFPSDADYSFLDITDEMTPAEQEALLASGLGDDLAGCVAESSLMGVLASM